MYTSPVGGLDPILSLAPILILAVIVFAVVASLMRSVKDSASPLETADVKVVSRRTNMTGGGNMMVSTLYHVTFEFRDGTRREYRVDGDAYGLMADGDEGQLQWQGSRFVQFVR